LDHPETAGYAQRKYIMITPQDSASLSGQASRNQLCACGSGKRFKHCCGAMSAPAAPRPAAAPGDKLRMALQSQLAGKLSEAERLYREVLGLDAHNIDAMHMLGVVCMERLRYPEALRLLFDAAERTGWAVPPIRHNLGLAIARVLTAEANARQEFLLAKHLEWQRQMAAANDPGAAPLVSVVIPSYNHAGYIGRAMSSVFEQTYRNLELVVIDDGSADGSPEIIAKLLEQCPFPNRFIARNNLGAEHTLNEGAGIARGSYLAFLNSDDYFSPDRMERMVAGIAAAGAGWGFSGVAFVDDRGMGVDKTHPVAQSHLRQISNVFGKISNSFAFLEFNPCISTGNLFVEKTLFDRLGGFRPLKYNHDWDFCLRASTLSEPLMVEAQLYHYRLHGNNTIGQSSEKNREDANRFFAEYYQSLETTVTAENELCPAHADNRILMYKLGLGVGHGELVPVDRLRSLCAPWLAGEPQADPAPVSAAGNDKVALVVLGMHRSGTSALSRALNLCGASLPVNKRPAKLNNNEKGFWEPEEVIQLNERLFKTIGASWLNARFNLAGRPELRADFIDDAAALLRAEYRGQPLILIKDPRICLLVPWWDEALRNAGYEPRYVIPVRNPLEVAGSLHARDGLPVDEGLALWLYYFDKAEADTRDACRVFVTYAELISDWKRCLAGISAAVDVQLDLAGKEQDVESFLEDRLRRQRSTDQLLFDLPPTPVNQAVKEKYRWALQQAAASNNP
jgi:glycosyltransferase involved in cell wall biosynthesis